MKETTIRRLYERAMTLRNKSEMLLEQSVTKALKFTDGNVRRASFLLGIPCGTLSGLILTGRLSHLSRLTSRKRGAPPK